MPVCNNFARDALITIIIKHITAGSDYRGPVCVCVCRSSQAFFINCTFFNFIPTPKHNNKLTTGMWWMSHNGRWCEMIMASTAAAAAAAQQLQDELFEFGVFHLQIMKIKQTHNVMIAWKIRRKNMSGSGGEEQKKSHNYVVILLWCLLLDSSAVNHN